MELYFMPSDIARLILGYLKENSYIKTYNCFLRECSHLRELYNLEKAGRSLKKVTQLSLIKIVEEWGRYKYSSDRSHAGSVNLTETPSSDDTADDNLVFDNDVTSSGRKTKPRARSSSKKSPQVSNTGRSPSTPKSLKAKLKSPRRAPSRNIDSKKTLKDDGVQVGNSGDTEATDESPENAENSTATKNRPNKLEIHLVQSDVKEKSVEPQNSVSNVAVSNKEISKTSESRKQQVSSNLANDSSMKTTEDVTSSKMKMGLSKQLGIEMAKGTISETEKEGKKLTEQDSVIKHKSEHENIDIMNMSEATIKETDETETQFTDHLTVKKSSKEKATIMSETFTKPIIEPPSESVGSVEDKCISWMSKNECENTSNTAASGELPETTDRLDHSNIHINEKTIQHEKAQEGGEGQEQICSEATASKSSGTASTHSSKALGVSSSNTSDEGVSGPVLTSPKKMSQSAPRNQLLVTPVKILHGSELNTRKSPRRKKPKTPRKRASEVSPVSVVSTKSTDPSSVNPIFEKILSDSRLHEKLAETCNLVHSQIKLATSGKEFKDKSDTVHADQISLMAAHHLEDQQTVTASRSLEEILEIDNFHTDLLSDNIDMSHPAYTSLFKLFGTDRETFNEYLRKEKEKELTLMEAEVEELERSNHEILCANFGVSQGDAGYETQELAYNSPHHIPLGSQQDLFSSQQDSHCPSHVTSTPCGNGVPVNFTPLLRRSELGNSPLHSSQSVFMALGKTGADMKTSPGSTATQPFSPALSHYSEVNNPPTPRHQQHLSTYISGSCHGNSPGGPRTPRNNIIDEYSNPTTPQQPSPQHSSPQHSRLMHSTPTGSVRSHADSEHFHQSSPIHSQHNTITNMHVPTHCSPLVKADLHPHSPFSTQNQTSVFHSTTNSGLYFNSQDMCRATIQKEHRGGYLSLLNDNSSGVTVTRVPCSTIDNTIGCISLPQPTNIQTKSDNEKKGADRKSRRKKQPVKRTESYSHLKGLLNKPLSIPNSVPLTMRAPGLHHFARTPEKRIPNEANLTFRSPGGKTMINVPVLNCEDEIDLSILGMEDNVDVEGSHVVNVYDQNLDTSTQYAIAPENQATHNLASAIQTGNADKIVKHMSERNIKETKPKRKTNRERKSRTKKKKEEVKRDDQHEEHFSPTPPSIDHPVLQQDGYLDPNEEVYTATIDTSIGKAATARALDFGPDIDSQYRKIMPKPTSEMGPSVLILSSKQMISPGQKIVVSTTPVTLMPNVNSTSSVNGKEETNVNSKVKPSPVENISTVKIIDASHSESSDGKSITKAAMSKSCEKVTKKLSKSMCDIEVALNEHNLEKTPHKEKQSPRHIQNTSNEKRITRSVTSSKSCEKENQSRKEFQVDDAEVAPDTQMLSETPFTESPRKTKNLLKKVSVNLSPALKSVKSNKENDFAEYSFKDDNDSLNAGRNTPNKNGKKEVSDHGNKSNKKVVASKTRKSRKNDAIEKLTVKLPVMSHRSPRCKTKESKSGIPFNFKKKTKILTEDTSSDEDVPLSEVRKKQARSKIRAPVAITIDSESSDEENGVVKEDVQLTPKKSKESSDEDRTPSKEILFEIIGLTPKKSPVEHDLKSPNKTNVLDVLAELQGSPASSRSCRRTSNSSKRLDSVDDVLKSPTTSRKAHAKQLFSSPDKKVKVSKKAKQTAKRVDGMIDRLKQHNPGRSLARSRQTMTISNTCTKTDKKSVDKNKKAQSKSVKADERNCNKNSEGSKINDENCKTQTKICKVLNEDPLVDIRTEDSSENYSQEEKKQAINSDQNAFLSDGNSQDRSELTRAIASIEFNQPNVLNEQEELAVEDEFDYNEDEDTEGKYGLHSTSDYLEHSHVKDNDYQDSDGNRNNVTARNEGFNEAVEVQGNTKHVISVQVHTSQDSQNTPNKYETLQDSRKSDKECETSSVGTFSDSEKKQSESKMLTEDNHKNSNTKVKDQEERRRKHRKKKHKHKHKHRHNRSDTKNESQLSNNSIEMALVSDKNCQSTSDMNRAVSSTKLCNTDSESLQEQIVVDTKYKQGELRNVQQMEENQEEFNYKNKSSVNLTVKDCDKAFSACFLSAGNPDTCEEVSQSQHTKHAIPVEMYALHTSQETPEKAEDMRIPQPVQQLNTENGKQLPEICSDFERTPYHSGKTTEDKCSSNNEVKTVRLHVPEERAVNSEEKDNLKHKKKKRRHKHGHRHRNDTNGGVNSVCEKSLGSCSEDAERHHHHKKKKSKKRHREEEEDRHESKRRRKEKTNTSVEMESLAAINIDDAISKIHGT